MRDIFSLMFPVCSKLFRENTPVNNGVVAFSSCLSGYCFVLKYNWQHLPILIPLTQLMKDTAVIYFSQDQGLSLENLSLEGDGKSPATTITVGTISFCLKIGKKAACSLLCWVRLESDVLLLHTNKKEDPLTRKGFAICQTDEMCRIAGHLPSDTTETIFQTFSGD